MYLLSDQYGLICPSLVTLYEMFEKVLARHILVEHWKKSVYHILAIFGRFVWLDRLYSILQYWVRLPALRRQR